MRQFLWLWLAALLCACSPEAPTKAPDIPKGAVVKDGRVILKTPALVYPEATMVKLFVSAESNFNPVFKESDGIILTDAQRAKVASAFSYIDVLEVINSDERVFAACFDPHHFFRYYNTSGKLIGEVQVCFCCGNTFSKPQVFTNELYAAHDDKKTWEIDQAVLYSLVKEMGLEPDVGCDY